jgi:hypothetical protein
VDNLHGCEIFVHLQIKLADVIIAKGSGKICKENVSPNVDGGMAAEMVLCLRPVNPQEWQG